MAIRTCATGRRKSSTVKVLKAPTYEAPAPAPPSPRGRPWREDEETYMLEHLDDGLTAVAQHLGRTERAVRHRTDAMGVKWPERSIIKIPAEETQWLKDNYESCTTQELRDRFPEVKINALMQRAWVLGLKRGARA